MTNDDVTPLSESLDVVRRDLQLGRPATLDRVRARWPHIVGEALANHSEVVAVRDGVVLVVVDEPAWASPVKFLEAEVVARLAEEALEEPVRALRVRVRKPGSDPSIW